LSPLRLIRRKAICSPWMCGTTYNASVALHERACQENRFRLSRELAFELLVLVSDSGVCEILGVGGELVQGTGKMFLTAQASAIRMHVRPPRASRRNRFSSR